MHSGNVVEVFVTEFESVCHKLIAIHLTNTISKSRWLYKCLGIKFFGEHRPNEHRYRCLFFSVRLLNISSNWTLTECLEVFEACVVIDFFVIYDGCDTEPAENQLNRLISCCFMHIIKSWVTTIYISYWFSLKIKFVLIWRSQTHLLYNLGISLMEDTLVSVVKEVFINKLSQSNQLKSDQVYFLVTRSIINLMTMGKRTIFVIITSHVLSFSPY